MPSSEFAESSPLSDFRIDVTLTNTSDAHTSIPVRCLSGCDWEQMIIECTGGESVCLATIEGRIHSDAPSDLQMGVRPISGTVCLGTASTSLEAAISQGLRAPAGPNVDVGRGSVIARVTDASPAALAGLQVGDLIVSFNGVPIREASEILGAIQSMAAGQQFKATLDRSGSLVEARGTLGMLTTAKTCVPADARLLETPAVTPEELEPTAFKLVMDAPNGSITATCSRGCVWEEAGIKGFAAPDDLHHETIVMDQLELRPATGEEL
jgi:hypothetical protein